MNASMHDPAHDLKDLLGVALDGDPGLDRHRAGPADPSGDLARGRALLRRRRLTIATGAVGGALAVVLAVPIAAGGWGNATSAPVAVPAATTSATGGASGPGGSGAAQTPEKTPEKTPETTLGSVELVAYTGEQPPGYRVSEVPDGWEIQGVDAYSLVIAPVGFRDQDTNSFLGKLVVMLQSKDAPVPGEGQAVTVNGLPARYHVETAEEDRKWQSESARTPKVEFEDTQGLVFQDSAKHWLVIQCPAKLGWDLNHLIKFAEGVTVLKGAQAGVG